MPKVKPIQQLIINSPFQEPAKHWEFNKTKNEHILKTSRRSASYIINDPQNKSYDEYGIVKEIPLVNKIRKRIAEWKKDNYQGITSTTRHLLEFWHTQQENSGRRYNFFFCQLEAIETLIFLLEAREDFKQGLKIPKDEMLNRFCCKMATGTGKTVVMAMTIAWQILNKVNHPQDIRFSKNIFIITPNLTVKERLNVLKSNYPHNYYREYKIIPHHWQERFREGKILIKNWHQLQWETEEKIQKKKGVDKRGPKSDRAYVKEVLEDMAQAKNILVINDEAHHAWRSPPEIKRKKRALQKEGIDVDQATKWIEGLDRIHKTIGIRQVFDFSATPYIPTGSTANQQGLFDWIVSDFGLADAIESGLVKTPKFAVGDDASINKTLKPRLYHIYENDDVKNDLNREASPQEHLPDIVKIGYTYLCDSWHKKYQTWKEASKQNLKDFCPPVMISVVNRKETADRLEYSFQNNHISIVPSSFQGSDKMLKVYSGLKADEDEKIREQLKNIGQIGKQEQHIHHVISVAMLSEGWNCTKVTHIMGLRAFSSQLLCEQIIGRGLRRTSYDLNDQGLFDPEYVSVLGVPFAYLPQEGNDTGQKEDITKHCIYPEKERSQYEILWPHVEKIQVDLKSKLSIDFKSMEPFTIDVSEIPRTQEMASVLDGKKIENITVLDLQKIFEEQTKYNLNDRLKTLTWKITDQVYRETSLNWKDEMLKADALKMIFYLVKQFLDSHKLQMKPDYEKERKDLIVMIKMNEIVNRILTLIRKDSAEQISAVYNKENHFCSTSDMGEWWTRKKVGAFKKTHLNQCVMDSHWEQAHARELDQNNKVLAFVKNDHLGFEVDYIDEEGKRRKYTPDFIIKLIEENYLVLEVKGNKKKKDIQKWDFMHNWCQAVSKDFEQKWCFQVSEDATGGQVHSIINEMTGL